MRSERKGWRLASVRGFAALMAVMTVFQLRPASAAPGDIFSIPAPVIGADPPKAADIKDGDASVATETGALTYSYPINVPPGRNGMAPHLALSYSSQAPIYGGIAAGWSLSIPEIKEDTSGGRIRTHYAPLESAQPDPRLDDRFISSFAGGRPLVLVSEPGDPNAYQYRAQNDASFARYERMKPGYDSDFKWRVYSTDGSIRLFGGALETSKCAHISDGFAPLTREIDEFGNEVRYTWTNGVTDECVIAKIEWGQNSSAGLDTFAAAEFNWDSSGISGTPPYCPAGTYPGESVDYRTGVRIVTGASKLLAITATAFAPGSSPSHTRTISLTYDTDAESCFAQHAPFRELHSIQESAVGADPNLAVALPPKTFTYNGATIAPGTPTYPGTPWAAAANGGDQISNVAWGYRFRDERWPSVEGMLLDVDGDGLLDRIFNAPQRSGDAVSECRAGWVRNTGPDSSGNPTFDPTLRYIQLPRLKWRGGSDPESAHGSATASLDHHEGCALNGQATAYRNSSEASSCHDFSSCQPATDAHDPNTYCNIGQGKGTECPPGRGGAGGQDPNTSPFLTYLAYRWMDMDGDGLVDLVAAVHGDIDVYDIEKGNLPGYKCPEGCDASCGNCDACTTCGEPAMPGIPGFDEWPPCPGEQSTCVNPGIIDGVHSCSDGTCSTNWGLITNSLVDASHVNCGRIMAKQGPGGSPNGTSGGGGVLSMSREPYQRCQGLYPWLIYKNRGNGSFDTNPTIKYQPVPLESDTGDSSLTGPAIASTNHAVLDFDGDGALDAIVREDECYSDPLDPHSPPVDCSTSPAPDLWNVFLGDRSGQLGPAVFMYPTRSHYFSFLSAVGTQDGPFARSSAGLVDLNGDGLPDHWYGHVSSGADVAFHIGVEQKVANGSGTQETAVKPGNDSGIVNASPSNWQVPSDIDHADTNIETRVVDVDGDGRLDVVHWNGGNPLVYFNVGEQFDSTAANYPGSFDGVKRQIKVTGSAPDIPIWELKSDLADLDGDGVPEVLSFNTGAFGRSTAGIAGPRLLSHIDNGRGAAMTITYASMHDLRAPTERVVEQDASDFFGPGRPKASPNNQWVVKTIESTDQFTAGTATSTYDYKDPYFGPDDEGRFSFRGFAQVTSTGPSGARTIERYSFDRDWSGRLVEAIVKPKLGSGEGDNDARNIDRTTWDLRTLFDGKVKVYLAMSSEHLVCANGQTDPAEQLSNPCTATSAAGYSLTTTTWREQASTVPMASTALLWVATDTAVQGQASPGDGDRTTTTTYALAADPTSYRLRPVLTTKTVTTGGAAELYGKSLSTWSLDLLTKTSEDVWLDSEVTHFARTSYTYERTGNVKTVANPRGRVTTYTYDSRDLFVQDEDRPTDSDDYSYKYEYGTGARTTVEGPTWAWCHIYSLATCPTGPNVIIRARREIDVDGLGRPREIRDVVDNDPENHTFALVTTELYSYIDIITASEPTSTTHQRVIGNWGGSTHFRKDSTKYDGHGRVIETRTFAQGSAPADNVTTYVHNPEGTLHSVTVPDPTANDTSTVSYDYTFDSVGRATSIRRPDAPNAADRSGVNIAYDGLEKTSSEVVGAAGGIPAATRTTSDVFGRLVQVEEQRTTTPDWSLTLYTYDANDDVVGVTDPEGHTTVMHHDFAGHRTAIIRGSRTWSYSYDVDGNMVSEETPSDCATNDAACRMAYTSVMAYDDLDRPSSRLNAPRDLSLADLALFGSSTEVFEHDFGVNATGRLSHWLSYAPDASDPTLEDGFNYEPQGAQTQHIQFFEGAGYSRLWRDALHAYYLGGLPWLNIYRDYVGGGGEYSLSWIDYDERGLPSDVKISTDRGVSYDTPPTVNTRNVAGLVTKQRTEGLPGAMSFIESNWTYDKLGRVTSQQVQKSGPTQVVREDMTYFGNDDPSSLSQWLGDDETQLHFTFDPRHQLKTVSESVLPNAFSAEYTYGLAGRFTHAVEAAANLAGSEVIPRDVDYHYDGTDPEEVTSLTQDGATFATYTYDLAGNMTQRTYPGIGESWDFVYDGKDRLRRATKRVNGVVTGSEDYWYDSDGNRTQVVHRNAGGLTTELVWFLEDQEAHFDPFGTATRSYSYVKLGTSVSRIDRKSDTETSIEYQFHGLGNSTLAAIDEYSGLVLASYRYAPYGTVIEATDASVGDDSDHQRRFNDKPRDRLSDLAYYGARYYDAVLMSWTQSDPVSRARPDTAGTSPGRANLYVFDLSNPLSYTDPDGRSPATAALRAGEWAAEKVPGPPVVKLGAGVATVLVVWAVASLWGEPLPPVDIPRVSDRGRPVPIESVPDSGKHVEPDATYGEPQGGVSEPKKNDEPVPEPMPDEKTDKIKPLPWPPKPPKTPLPPARIIPKKPGRLSSGASTQSTTGRRANTTDTNSKPADYSGDGKVSDEEESEWMKRQQ